MRGALLIAWVLALVLVPSGWAGAQETTHEILVGYNSEQDRRDAEREFAQTKDKLKVRGQSLESLQVQAISAKALKLKVGLPPSIRAEIARTPALATTIIQGLAEQLEQADKRVAYAHPNWVMQMAPPAARAGTGPVAPRSATLAPPKESKRSAKRARAHAAQPRRHRKVSARRRCHCWPEIAWLAPCFDRTWRAAVASLHHW